MDQAWSDFSQCIAVLHNLLAVIELVDHLHVRTNLDLIDNTATFLWLALHTKVSHVKTMAASWFHGYLYYIIIMSNHMDSCAILGIRYVLDALSFSLCNYFLS